jgi:hypothetical protein
MLVLLFRKTSETAAVPVCVFLTILNVLKITVPNNGRLQQLRAEKESKLQETERLKSQQKMDDLQLRRLSLRIQGTVAQILSV